MPSSVLGCWEYVLGIKFFCLEHFCTNHSQICDCQSCKLLAFVKSLETVGCIIWEDIGSLAQMSICGDVHLSRIYALVYNLNSKSVLNLNFVEQKKNHLML